MTTRRAWKKLEERTAKKFNTQRTPLSGSMSKHTSSDTLSKQFYIECKFRKKISLNSLFKEISDKAKKEKKIPILVLHEKYKRQDLAVMRLDDLVSLLNKKSII